jgi:hypothetical protein
MKTILPAMLILVACGTANTKTAEKSFVIPSYPETQKNPYADTANHKPGDVEMFRVLGKDTVYFTRLYRVDNGEIRQYESVIVQNTNYDKGSYQWINDSTLLFNLIDSKNDKRQSFHMIGSGGSTTLQDIK